MGITQVQADEIVKHKIITSENQEFFPSSSRRGAAKASKEDNAETDAVTGPSRIRAFGQEG